MLRFLVVGIGQCGNRVADAVLRDSKAGGRLTRILGGKKGGPQCAVNVVALNSSENDLRELKIIPAKDRILLHGTAGGVGANREAGKKVFADNRDRVQAAVHALAPWDAVFVITSTGGGTGSGGSPALVEVLRNMVRAPIVVVSVLPFKEESDIFMQNTGFALKELKAASPETVLLASNDFLKSGTASIVEAYDRINAMIAGRIIFLMHALSSEMMMSADLGDVATVLKSGSGFSTMGYTQGTEHQPLKEVIEQSFATANLLFEADAFTEAARAMIIIEGGETHLTMEHITESVKAFSQKVGDVFKAVRVTEGPPRVLSLFSLDASAELERTLDRAFEVMERRKEKRREAEASSKLGSKFDRMVDYELDA